PHDPSTRKQPSLKSPAGKSASAEIQAKKVPVSKMSPAKTAAVKRPLANLKAEPKVGKTEHLAKKQHAPATPTAQRTNKAAAQSRVEKELKSNSRDAALPNRKTKRTLASGKQAGTKPSAARPAQKKLKSVSRQKADPRRDSKKIRAARKPA